MVINLSPRVRAAIYVLSLILAPVVVYLRAKGVIGDLELTLWGAEVTAVTGMAALNVANGPEAVERPFGEGHTPSINDEA